MCCPYQHDTQVHPEKRFEIRKDYLLGVVLPKVKYGENLRLGKSKYNYPSELGESDAGEDRAPHISEDIASTLCSTSTNIDRESSGHVTTKLYTNTHSHDQIDQGNGIQGDVPPVHETAKVEDDENDDEQVDERRHKIESHQNKCN